MGCYNYIYMGQSGTCQRGGEPSEEGEPREEEFAHYLRVKLQAVGKQQVAEPVDTHNPSQYSSLVAKLNRYGKEQLANMLIRPSQAESIKKKQEGSIEASKILHHPTDGCPQLPTQNRQNRQLLTLRQECQRIGQLEAEMLKKAKRRRQQQGKQNQVHFHRQMFSSTDQPQEQLETSPQTNY